MAVRVLIVDDEPQIRKFLIQGLSAEGYQLEGASSLFEARSVIWAQKADICILDLQLPDGNGTDFLKELRTWSDLPVIVLTVQSQDEDKIRALDAGADDYVTKPFSLPELLARLRVALRHKQSKDPDIEFQFGDCLININARTVKKNGADVHLTDLEFRLLALLLKNRGRVLTHRHILREVWGPHQEDDLQYLRMYIAALRKKLEDIPAEPKWILTEAGVGYRIVDI